MTGGGANHHLSADDVSCDLIVGLRICAAQHKYASDLEVPQVRLLVAPLAMEERMRRYRKAPPGKRYVFRPYRTDPRTGKVLWAREYGLKAWPILVDK